MSSDNLLRRVIFTHGLGQSGELETIHRVWIQRTVKDLGLARRLRAAITAVRAAG